MNPFREAAAFVQVLRAYRSFRPDLVHHVALKPIVYGGIAARLCGGIPTVNAVAGLGHVFTSQSMGMRLMRRLLVILLRLSCGGQASRTIFQNFSDRDYLQSVGVTGARRAAVIGGCGVDVDRFAPLPEPSSPPIVMMASRMLWEKGVGEFVSAAKILKARGVSARFVLAGAPDNANPSSIPEGQLRHWAESGCVEWWGHRDDMEEVLARSSLVCLPSYREGLPKILIEAAACGRAIVATNVPGCEEIVRNGVNGVLVPPRDPDALARAIDALLKDSRARTRMGERGREIALQKFKEEDVVRETIAVYRELLGSRFASLAEMRTSS